MEDLFTFTSAAWLRGSAGGEPPVVTSLYLIAWLRVGLINVFGGVPGGLS